MGLFSLLANVRTARQIRKLAVVVAERSEGPVRDRLATHVYRMSLAEARGYIQARAALVVKQEMVGILAMEGRLPAWGHTELAKQSTALLAQQLAAELSHSHTPAKRRLVG